MVKSLLFLIVCLCIAFLLLTLLATIVAKIIKKAKKKANFFPTKSIEIDITNQKVGDNSDLLDYYIINCGIEELEKHFDFVENWKREQREKLGFNQKKLEKFENKFAQNSKFAFHFAGFRIKTRYETCDYEKTPYKVKVKTHSFYASLGAVKKRIDFLKSNDFYVTYNNFTRVDQRKAMTQKLRTHIKKRDNFTCQICGKYMPDEVGLHIDHIIPIKKGGKSTPSNLRVLCSKCNGKKSSN